jgi:hypothetical protein
LPEDLREVIWDITPPELRPSLFADSPAEDAP